MATPAVLFPDAAAVFITGITDAFAASATDVLVAGEVPSPRPDEFVTIRRLGGIRRDLITDLPQLAFECWSTTLLAAHDLAQLTRALALALRGQVINGTTVGRIDELSGPAELPDISEQPRVTFSLIPALRGTAL